MDAASANRFEAEIASYHRWREELTQSVHAYHDWLESNGHLDVQQSIRFYDLLENLNKGRLMLAFLAEYSRGKSELINALFFSDFKERLLPSDVGRTTMCPTEIFHDPSEEPYLKLLSVETRYRDESISQLKNMPIEWSKLRLNVNSAADMKKQLKALADTKKVYALEARMLGLAPMVNEKGELPGEEELVEVPAWRYAMINYPHPLLTNGISILDTPGLNALGMEPELTVATIPNAHAVLFLLSIDTGVTKSDLEIWDRYVKPGLPQKIAVLNKIDITWDELKTQAQIDEAIGRMVDTTAQNLKLPRERIFPLSAQKALLGRIKGDEELVKKSGITNLERFLAEEIVPMKRSILCRAVTGEIGGMMMSSRALVAKKQEANQAEVGDLQGMVGKSRAVVQQLWAKITAEKNAYNAALAEYKVNHAQFSAKKAALLDRLNPQKLDQTLARSAQAIEDSWTTVGLQRGMSTLVKDMSGDFEAVFVASEDIKKLMQGVYNTFIEKFGFQKMKLPTLDLDPHRTKLQLLVMQTEQFVKDPVNVVVKEKHFVVKNFYSTLVKAARANFTDAKAQSERWVQAVVLPLEVQIKDHKNQLQSRLDNLAKINEKTTSINEQMAVLKAAEADLGKQRAMIEGLIERVSAYKDENENQVFDPESTVPGAPKPPVMDPMKTQKMTVAQAQPASPAPAKKKPDAPLVSDDDFMKDLQAIEASKKQPPPPPPSEDRTRTMKMPAGPETTQRLGAKPVVPEKPAAFNPESTMKIPALDPAFRPDQTQKMDAAPSSGPDTTQKIDPQAAPGPESTQPLEESIWKLQEAKRMLQGLKQK